MTSKRLDIIIFAATGFTGRYAVKYAVQFCKEKKLKFGIAGRKKEDLEAVVQEYSPDIDVPIIIANLLNHESTIEMTKQAKVLVNCCGPYRLYGERVISACISTGTHHVDVSGEPQYMEEMQLKYFDEAKRAGIYIVSACGFDSIPADMGVIYAQKKFDGVINSIETYVKSNQDSNVSEGSSLNYGTWESLVISLNTWSELKEIRRKLFPEEYPKFYPKLKRRSIIHKSDISEGWSTMFLGADSSVIYRTQRFFYQKYNKRPIQVKTYLTLKNCWMIMMLLFASVFLFLMTRTMCTCNLLLKYPGIFSFGFVTKEKPKKEVLENTKMIMMFRAHGWAQKLDGVHVYEQPPHKELITKITAYNPGYGVTGIALILSAIMILKESDKMPDEGGVYTPGAAFASTSLIEELDKNGIKFEVVSCTEIEASKSRI